MSISSRAGARSLSVSRNKDPYAKISTNGLVRKVMLRKADTRLDKIIAKFDPDAPSKTGSDFKVDQSMFKLAK